MMREFKVQNNSLTNRSWTVEKYFQEIQKEPMLSPEEEAHLAFLIRQGGKEGEKAKEKLIRANLRFVVTVAKSYHFQNTSGLTLADLIDEGNLGLIHAAELYDETRGFKFVSYAVWWIRQNIILAINNYSTTVRMPLNQISNVNKVNKIVDRFEKINGRRPTDDEILEETDLTEEELRRTMANKSVTIGLDTPLGDDGDSALCDVLDINNIDSTDKHLENDYLNFEIKRILSSLKEREREIITKFFGLDGKEYTYDEIAEMMNLSRERVRQLKEKTIRLLRIKTGINEMRQYL